MKSRVESKHMPDGERSSVPDPQNYISSSSTTTSSSLPPVKQVPIPPSVAILFVIAMTSSQKLFNTDLNETKEIEAPIDVMNIMLEYAGFDNVSDHGKVPLVSTLFSSIKTQKLARLKNLLTAIVEGKPDEVEEIFEKDPSLLLEKLEEKDYVTAPSGQRSNNATAYRTALAVEDNQIAAMIKAKLIEVAGEDAANAQYREQFPVGWEADERKKWEPIFTQLDTLDNFIKDAKGDITSSGDPEYKLTVREGSAVAVALAQFRSRLDILLHETVTSGRHFNPDLLLKAYDTYRYYDWQRYCKGECILLCDCQSYGKDDWKDPRALLFWQQVIGTIQRGLPVNYVQAFCDTISTTEEKLRNNTPQGRSLKIRLFNSEGTWVSADFYPLARPGLGFDYAIDIEGRAWNGYGNMRTTSILHQVFECYVHQKRGACMDLLYHRFIYYTHTPAPKR